LYKIYVTAPRFSFTGTPLKSYNGYVETEDEMDGKLRILVIGAHPDDCDIRTGGTAILFAQLGHSVKFISATNGASGHHIIGGMPLAQRRNAEAQRAGESGGFEYELLDNPDGWLTTDLNARAGFIKAMRQFRPDIIITHRPNDYHPDHRNTSVLVQDSSYLVTVQSICPFVPALDYQPIILYMRDPFQKPLPFKADIVIDIDGIMDRKMKMFACHESQVYEFLPFMMKISHEVPEGEEARLEFVKRIWGSEDETAANECRAELIAKYGVNRGATIRYAEAFEVCEYGGKLEPEDHKRYFPF
jgi:LmbE family N-acetylglucosaminyl deacetylase